MDQESTLLSTRLRGPVFVVIIGKSATNVVYKHYSYLFLLSLLVVIVEWSPLLDN